MKKKSIKLLALGVASIFVCVVSVSAITQYVAFSFSSVGQKQETTQSLKAGTDVLKADLFETGNATMGLSLSKSGLLGWSFISRCNPSVEGKTSVSCTWKDQKKGTFKGTAVLNTKDSSFNGSVSGQLSLYNS